jgi:hypothetical protein
MMKLFPLACVTLAALAACASEPEPQPDAAVIERAELANSVASDAPKLEKADRLPKLEKADRLVAAVDRADPDRLAGPAEALLAR